MLIPELEVEGYSYDEVIAALSLLGSEGYEVSVVGDVIKVKLHAR